ncbi:hypothetical protein OPT61_g2090 [Boeremia exigua]|uniref:Uncharacterized protein n=1 Tax=Boeremia exigua TaxID=749465 RepID=A0ACC2IMR5_9PLEO|nr:hypothetical protein OPT61_g2090 [Boeremia exigua]
MGYCLGNKKADKKKEAKEAKDVALRKEKREDNDNIQARKSAIKGLEPGAEKGKKGKIDGDYDGYFVLLYSPKKVLQASCTTTTPSHPKELEALLCETAGSMRGLN